LNWTILIDDLGLHGIRSGFGWTGRHGAWFMVDKFGVRARFNQRGFTGCRKEMRGNSYGKPVSGGFLVTYPAQTGEGKHEPNSGGSIRMLAFLKDRCWQ
jgi:hypothetical protein